MNWKEFFKPTKTKIIFICIIFAISIFFGFKHISPECNLPGCYSSLEPNKIIFPLSYSIVPMFFQRSPILAPIISFGIIYIVGIFYWYIALCIIIFVFKKLKKFFPYSNH